ncbi:glycosyltransferase family 2 protein [Roseobacter sp. EG26]|uniref:glycosyltransferase family 2 protein n=1 Tax=Roseobacter sp. EG26 TaxID=3412477 RepID=UPI003CE5B382
MTLAAVVIGRNEGARLIRCLASLKGHTAPVVYVDSGSTDGSVAAAKAAGAAVVELDMTQPFTAARARNAGLAHLRGLSEAEYVQVIDGDCELREGWTETALSFLADHPDVAIIAGRLRERFPEASLWNQLADAEWDTPVGETEAVGGIAILRRTAVEAVGGYRDSLIAGEEPELCLRLRRAGWRIWRCDAEMAWHDIAMTRFSQWWRRARRHGHAIAEGAFLHGSGPEGYCRPQTRRALIWGLGVPLAAGIGALVWPFAGALLLVWPAQVLRLKARGEDWIQALFLTLGKLPEAQGVLGYHMARLKGAGPRIIEYK